MDNSHTVLSCGVGHEMREVGAEWKDAWTM